MEKKILFLVILIGVIIYSPSLFLFFTHDDFFHLKIAQANSIWDIVNFFNLTKAPEGFGFYRPITTQLFFLLGYLTNLNPLILHIISFLGYITLIFLVYKLVFLFTNNKLITLTATFLYTVSATHFGHLYYLSTFQEIGLGVFYFLTVIFFIKYIAKPVNKYLIFSFLSFLGALGSKEFAVTIPVILIFTYIYFQKSYILKKNLYLFFTLIFSLLIGYLYLHIFYYGLAQGDSYIWDISPRIINTLLWYVLWSLNLPEMMVDFIGPGFVPTQNFYRYYIYDFVRVLIPFFMMLVLIIYTIIKHWKREYIILLLYTSSWFIVTLLPVLFLPLHKFAYELTVPLFGVVLFMSTVIMANKKLGYIVIFLFFLTSLLTIRLTHQTHWIVQGSKASQIVHELLITRPGIETVYFYDTDADKLLPWSPTEQLKILLSNQNYFDVFFNGSIKAYYNIKPDIITNNILTIESSKILY